MTFIVFFIIVCVVTALKQRLLAAFREFDEDEVLTRNFGSLLTFTGLLLMGFLLLGSWTVVGILLSTPCFWALGSLARRWSGQGVHTRPKARKIPVHESTIRRTSAPAVPTEGRSLLVPVFIFVLLYWITQSREEGAEPRTTTSSTQTAADQ